MKFNEKLISIRKMRGLSQERIRNGASGFKTDHFQMGKRPIAKIFCYAGLILIAAIILGFILHLLFPDIQWLWGSTR